MLHTSQCIFRVMQSSQVLCAHLGSLPLIICQKRFFYFPWSDKVDIFRLRHSSFSHKMEDLQSRQFLTQRLTKNPSNLGPLLFLSKAFLTELIWHLAVNLISLYSHILWVTNHLCPKVNWYINKSEVKDPSINTSTNSHITSAREAAGEKTRGPRFNAHWVWLFVGFHRLTMMSILCNTLNFVFCVKISSEVCEETLATDKEKGRIMCESLLGYIQ